MEFKWSSRRSSSRAPTTPPTILFRTRASGYHLMLTSVVLLLLAVVLVEKVSSYPDGAPGETCVRHKPNHGGKPQPLDAMPFSVEATASSYKPGDTAAVRIMGKDEMYFRGFFVQAVDERGRWIGTFESTPFSVSHPECSATTHSENQEKEEVTLIWHPPKDSYGTVRFLASIVNNYKMYWVDAPAKAPSSKIEKPSKSTEE